MAVTKAWKVYGAEGHRQRESFAKSQKYDWSKDGETRILESFCSDRTGTNDFMILKITRDTEEECLEEFDGQLYDGWFENSRKGKIVEIDPIELDAMPKI